MSQSLKDFLLETKRELDSFENWWMEMHAAYPDAFPLELEDDDVGLWDEHFRGFASEEAISVERMGKLLDGYEDERGSVDVRGLSREGGESGSVEGLRGCDVETSDGGG